LSEQLFALSLRTLQQRHRVLQFEEFSSDEGKQNGLYDCFVYNLSAEPLSFRFVQRKSGEDYLQVFQSEIDTPLDPKRNVRIVVLLDIDINSQRKPQKQTAEIIMTIHHAFEDPQSFTSLINELLVLLFERDTKLRKEIETTQTEFCPSIEELVSFREDYTNEENHIKEGVQPLLDEIKGILMNPFDNSKSKAELIGIYEKLKSTDEQLFLLEQQQHKQSRDLSKDLSKIRHQILSILFKLNDKIIDRMTYDAPLCKAFDRQTRCRTLRIEEPLFSLINKVISRHNLPLNPLITAVCFFAIAKREYQLQKKNQEKDDLIIGAGTAINLRTDVTPPIPKTSLGIMIGAHKSFHLVKRNQTKLWSLTKEIHDDLSNADKKNWKYLQIIQELFQPLPEDIQQFPQFIPFLSFSNLEVAENELQSCYECYPDDPQNSLHAKVKVDMIYTGVQLRGFNDWIFYTTEVKNTLCICLSYVSPMISEESAQSVLDTIHSILQSIGNDPSHDPVIQ